jgi:N-acetyl-anhydromuramyl-L-alanine amidase AmpD
MRTTKINRQFISPNYDPELIPVEFLVLHYTAGSLQATLDLFMNPDQEVSSHLVIDEKGNIYELVACWDGAPQRAWHAGRSKWLEGETEWSEFNNFSIGIEIVNCNGNLLPYSDEQYRALKITTEYLRAKFPSLDDPKRVVGHEQIAGWRGKIDPGLHFDWQKYYSSCFENQAHPFRQKFCHPEIANSFQRFTQIFPEYSEAPAEIWHAISHTMETCNRILQVQKKCE